MEKNLWPVTANSIGSSTNQELKKQLKIITVNRFIKSQKIQWAGHVMRRNAEAATKVVLDWKPEEKISRGCPRKRWIDGVEKDLEDLGAQNWREIVQDRSNMMLHIWQQVVPVASILAQSIQSTWWQTLIINQSLVCCLLKWIQYWLLIQISKYNIKHISNLPYAIWCTNNITYHFPHSSSGINNLCFNDNMLNMTSFCLDAMSTRCLDMILRNKI